MSNFSRNVFRNSSWGLVAQAAIKVLSFAFSVFVIRSLGAQDYGQYSAVLAFTGAFAVISDLGLGTYAVRQVARWRDHSDSRARIESLYANVLALRLVLSLLTALLLVVAAWLTSRPAAMVGAVGLNSLSLVLYAYQGSSEAVLGGYERLDITAQSKIVSQAIFVVVGAAVLGLGFGYLGLIIANLLGIAGMALVTWRGLRMLRLSPQGISSEAWWNLLRASLPFGIIGLALGLSYKFDSILLNILRGDAETGYYSAAYNLVFSAFLISGTVNSSLYPSLARELQRAPEAMPKIVERVFSYLMVISLPLAVGGWALSGQIVGFLYSDEYLPSIVALKIVIWAIPLMYSTDLLGYVVLLLDRESQAAKSVAISTVLNISLNLFFVPRYGLLAASTMTVITEAVLLAQYAKILRKYLQDLDWSKVLVKPAIAASAMGGVLLLSHSYLGLAANVALGAVAFGIAVVVLKVVGYPEIQFIRELVTTQRGL